MRNRSVGLVLLGIVVLMGFMTYSFNSALTSIVNESCSHGPSCPMWGSIQFQTNVSIALIGLVIVVAGYLIYSDSGTAATKKKRAPKGLLPDEKKVFDTVTSAGGTIFQSELVEKTGLTKVKMTRILDKLEGKGLVERKRRGMTNVVILQN
ncbi:helix-turn-helix transcriptional regulator [archaeon]